MTGSRFLGFAVAGFVFVAVGSLGARAADHPGSSSDCASCHQFTAKGEAPKVVPVDPPFLAKIPQGKVSFRGHKSVPCAGTVNAAGQVTGCHRSESGFPDHLVMNLAGRPSDDLCGKCHPNQRVQGKHHPSYRKDENGDGVPEKIVQPPAVQEVFTTFAPASQSEPLRTYPDSAAFTLTPEGKRVLNAAIPLAKVTEKDPVTQKNIEVSGVVTCVSCHNPHFGYLVEADTEEALQKEIQTEMKAGQPEIPSWRGNVLLRMRDRDNSLCLTCH